MARRLRNLLLKTLGWTMVVVGLIIFVLPVPLGIPTVAAGLVILISTSKTARRWVRLLRIRFGWVDGAFTYIETSVPGPTRTVLRKTRRRIIGRPVRPSV